MVQEIPTTQRPWYSFSKRMRDRRSTGPPRRRSADLQAARAPPAERRPRRPPAGRSCAWATHATSGSLYRLAGVVAGPEARILQNGPQGPTWDRLQCDKPEVAGVAEACRHRKGGNQLLVDAMQRLHPVRSHQLEIEAFLCARNRDHRPSPWAIGDEAGAHRPRRTAEVLEEARGSFPVQSGGRTLCSRQPISSVSEPSRNAWIMLVTHGTCIVR